MIKNISIRPTRIQNLLMDLGFFCLVMALILPIAAWHFETPDQNSGNMIPNWYVGILIGAMIPEIFFSGLMGIIGLFYHSRKKRQLEHVSRAFLIFTLVYFAIFSLSWTIRMFFFPNMLDCLLSAIWSASPCASVDVDMRSRSFLVYFIYIGLPLIFIFLNILIFLLNKMKQNKE